MGRLSILCSLVRAASLAIEAAPCPEPWASNTATHRLGEWMSARAPFTPCAAMSMGEGSACCADRWQAMDQSPSPHGLRAE